MLKPVPDFEFIPKAPLCMEDAAEVRLQTLLSKETKRYLRIGRLRCGKATSQGANSTSHFPVCSEDMTSESVVIDKIKSQRSSSGNTRNGFRRSVDTRQHQNAVAVANLTIDADYRQAAILWILTVWFKHCSSMFLLRPHGKIRIRYPLRSVLQNQCCILEIYRINS